MGLFSKRKSNKGNNSVDYNAEYTIDPVSLKIEKNTEKEIFGKQSFPSVLYTPAFLKSGGLFHHYMNKINNIEFDEKDIEFDDNLEMSDFFKSQSKISDIIHSDIKPFDYDNYQPYNSVVEKIFTKGTLLKNNKSETYIKKGDNNSIELQVILICRMCQDLPLTKITHFRQQAGNVYFYCSAHNEKKQEEAKTFPIEEFLENYPNPNNIRILTKMSDFKPTIINHSLKVEGRKDFIKIESENIDIDFKAGEKYNIDEQLAKIKEEKEKEIAEKMKLAKEDGHKLVDRLLKDLDELNDEKSVENLKKQLNERTFQHKDEYALEMINSLNNGLKDKEDTIDSLFNN